MPTLTILTISTGDASLLTQGALQALEQAPLRVLRTGKHRLAAWLDERALPYQTLDDLYVTCEDFDQFNREAAKRLLTLSRQGNVAYAVADAGMDSTVAELRQSATPETEILELPGVSHADRCLALMKASRSGLRVLSAESFRAARVTPDEPLLLCELHSRECASECKLRLMRLLPEDTAVQYFTGTVEGALVQAEIPLYMLDRQAVYDHLTACYIPAVPMLNRARFDMDDLVAVMAKLRAPDGCPWDREQSHESLLTNLLEESYEFIGAVRDGDVDHMYDELGDVLLQVVFHAEIARQHGNFDINDVTTAITQKMIERHPHIFGTVHAETSAQVLDNWDAIKRRQRGIRSVSEAMEDVSTGLSPAMRADKVQHKAAKIGFDFPDALSALAKVHEEAEEVRECLENGQNPEMELGDLFFSAVNVCRLCKLNPDIALFSATNKFIDRFRKMEKSVEKAGKSIEDLTLSEMDVYWEAEKQASPSSEG
ncbi:MAG TPA: nucleoside triphosphate pyrophosphohydrolase [Candidatus Limiplasma sp.]|nr:nucleoside triphosphate pyrophosphohydrolase [Candidatus Limiplasma sp.]HPS80551.1 nucleoside triphosphate pyrophosphohydrolase [Candidatus Limiplasma sp.]